MTDEGTGVDTVTPLAASAVVGALRALAAEMPGGGEDRPEQAAMAQAVADAISSGLHLVVQAGTGTGKSLAYLIPALMSGAKVVVATATKALQDQLAGKDLPFLAEHLPHGFEFQVLKGRSNYLCKQKANEVSGGNEELDLEPGARGGISEEIGLLLAWAKTSPTGDRSELDFEPRPKAWSQVSVHATECPGAAKCPVGDGCYAEMARKRALEADLIVVNIALYGMHLVSGGFLLPEHDVVIFDEAHELEDVAASALGLEMTEGRFGALARTSAGIVDKASTPVATAVAEAGELLARVLGPKVGARIAAPKNGAIGIDDADLSGVMAMAAERVRALSAALRAVAADTGTDLGNRKARAQQAAGHLALDLAFVAELATTHVAWVEGTPREPVLKVAAVDVGRLLSEQLWGQVTGILTSATIPPHIGPRLGLPKDEMVELDVGTPFDAKSSGLLYVPRHLPDPRHAGYEEAMHAELTWLITQAGGRTLALFTSYKRMQAAADALTGTLPGPVLVQGQLPKPALIEAFTSDEATSLFATMGFWQGIDVPGRTLSLVTIDRIPFPRPDEPLMEARRERAGQAAFRTVDVPRAATMLAQGAGRLLRTKGDKGVVAVLDPRLATAGYRADLLAPVPNFKRTIRRDEVAAFFAEILA